MKWQGIILELAKLALLVVLLGVAMFAFFMLVGEETPDNTMTIGEFFALKLGALATLYGLAQLGRYLYNHRLLPHSFIDDINKEENL